MLFRSFLSASISASIAVVVSLSFACSDDIPEVPTDEAAVAPEAGAEGNPDEAAKADAEPAEGEEKPAEAKEDEAPKAIVASIGIIEGKVLVNKKPAKAGQALEEGDTIKAKKKGFADIYFTDGSKFRLTGGSLVLKTFEKEVSIKLVLGKLYSWVNSGTPYDVETVNGTAGVRGTKFFVEAKKKKTYICVCEGTVMATGLHKKDAGKEIAVEAGFDLNLVKKKPAKAPKASPSMAKMTNVVFDDMAAKAPKAEAPKDEAAPEGDDKEAAPEVAPETE